MKWQFINNGKAQIDEAGNILQIGGGVVPKACQKCKQEFISEIVKTELKQPVSIYKCGECSFKSSAGDAAYDHKLETSHNIKKTQKDKIVGYENKIQGVTANITKADDNVIILCGACS
jgi:hypothetical protein